MPHSLRRKLTPAGIAANLSLVAILGSFVAIAPIAGLTGTAQAATIAGEASNASTVTPRDVKCNASAPVPQPISRTRSPGCQRGSM